MCSITIANNTVLNTENVLREWILGVLTQGAHTHTQMITMRRDGYVKLLDLITNLLCLCS